MRARLVIPVLLAAMAIVTAADRIGRATMPGPKPGPSAEPRSTHQVGFPDLLRGWSVPADNPQTPAKVELGKALFFEPRLSVDNTVACASCHDPGKGFTDRQATSDGAHMKTGERNAPTIVNAIFNIDQFWDDREPTLEAQAGDPILNPIEMRMPDRQTVVSTLNSISEYQTEFQAVFGAAPNYDDMTKAITAYEWTQLGFDSPCDHFMAGDENAITAQQKHGWAIFNGQGRCMSCHGWNPTRPLFTDDRFHNIGVSAHKSNFVPLARQALDELVKGASAQDLDRLAIQTDMSGLGRFLVTKQPHDIGAFRTMGLRNLYVGQFGILSGRGSFIGTSTAVPASKATAPGASPCETSPSVTRTWSS